MCVCVYVCAMSLHKNTVDQVAGTALARQPDCDIKAHFLQK